MNEPRALALVAVTLLLASCVDADTHGATQVKMLDNAYNAPVVRIPAGAGVIFQNAGRTPHNVVPVDPARWPVEGDAPTIEPGGTQAVTLDEPGVYEYYCSFHGTPDGRGMAGTVVVGDVEYAGSAAARLPAVADPTGTVRRVPQQHATIQGAVDAAVPGDLILVDTGTYREEVTVTTPSLVIRGMDRNATIVDGEFVRPNGFNVLADGVAIENLTVRHATLNGFFWTGVIGYRGSWLTAYNNGDYGVYAFDSRDGVFEDSYASGSPDAGFYIGQCFPCDAVVRRVTAEHNAVGFSGTNAGGDLYVLSSTWRFNRAGVVPNSLDTELHPPQRATTIRGNLIHDNHSRTAGGRGLTPLAWGNGVVVGGGRENIVEDNAIANHAGHGVMIAPLVDRNFWAVRDNAVHRNLVLNSGRADVSVGGPASDGNCVGEQLNATVRAPRTLGCTGGRSVGQNDLVPALMLAFRMWRLRDAAYPDWKAQPVPPPQPTMPDAATAPARPAVGVFAGLRGTVDDAPLPPQADSVMRAASERRALAGPAPRLARVQSWLPVTPVLLLLALAWSVYLRVRTTQRRRAGKGIAGYVLSWRVSMAVFAVWITLAVTVAVAFSAT
jgi:plastocyanin